MSYLITNSERSRDILNSLYLTIQYNKVVKARLMIWLCAPRPRSFLAPCVFGFNSGRWKTLQKFSRGFSCPTQQSQSAGMLMSSGSSARFRPAYDWQDNVQDLEDYRWGGYHPIQLGDELSNRRYHVIHKLGYGRYSTVWLVRDRVEK